jgi:excisionase family DNA binding protein
MAELQERLHCRALIVSIKYASSAPPGEFGKMSRVNPNPPVPDTCSTTEAAQRLGMAVRSVQLMVDRGELQAWKTPGGHRRILRSSLDQWLASRAGAGPAPMAAKPPAATGAGRPMTLLLIEDSVHFQNLISLIVKRELPGAELHVASDGIAGLALAGRLEPDVLLIDILLPGIDGAALITSLRSHPQFARSRLIVITALDEAQREPYRFALEGVPVVHKTAVVGQLPPLLAEAAAAQPG